MNAPTVAASLVRAVLRSAEAHGIPADALLHAVRAGPDTVADLDRRFLLSDFHKLVGEVIRRSRDPAIALRIGRQTSVGATGLVGYAALSAGTLGAALGVLNRYRRIVSDEMHLHVSGALHQQVRLTLVQGPVSGRLSRGDFELGLALLHSQLRWITGGKLRPRESWFPHPAPGHAAVYTRIFGCPARFGMSACALVVNATDLSLPTVELDPVMHKHFQSMLDATLRHLELPPSIVRDCQEAILPSLGPERANVQGVARILGRSVRSLQRELARAGTSFSMVRDDVVRRSALEQLRDSRFGLEEIAFYHGYASSSAFVHAVRRWTDMTPLEYRRQGQLGGVSRSRNGSPSSGTGAGKT